MVMPPLAARGRNVIVVAKSVVLLTGLPPTFAFGPRHNWLPPLRKKVPY